MQVLSCSEGVCRMKRLYPTRLLHILVPNSNASFDVNQLGLVYHRVNVVCVILFSEGKVG